jgi:hypothetical protein
MKTKRTFGLVAVSLALILSILACGGGKIASPTAVKAKPTATEVSVEKPATPTDIVEEPTATELASEPAPTEAAAQPTEAVTGNTPDCSTVPDGELGVAYDRGYKDNTDSWQVIGLVCNNTQEAVSNIQMSVEVFDKNNKSLYTEHNVETALYSVDAGDSTPFSSEISQDLPTADT